MWAPHSPGLNPLDLSGWNDLQAWVQAISHPSLELIKARIVATWEALKVTYIIRTSPKTFRPRVDAVIAADSFFLESAK